jgi:gamma-glutamylcyclotransferase (GGCT)/AIG2-like uncharacterized protein YtfP
MEAINSKEPQQGALYAVYGTLRHGFGNWSRLLNNEHCEYLGEQRTEPKYKMVSLGAFPGVILGGNQEVTIEVFRVNSPDVELRLDWLEGYPSFYQKTTIDTKWGKADMYILSEERYGNNQIVPSGDWKEYTTNRVK